MRNFLIDSNKKLYVKKVTFHSNSFKVAEDMFKIITNGLKAIFKLLSSLGMERGREGENYFTSIPSD